MDKRLGALVVALLVVGTAAHAQSRGGGGRRGGGSRSPAPSPTASPTTPAPRPAQAGKVYIVGVVKEIGPAGDRITIAYDAVEALNWPAGTNSFVVARTELLKSITPGEKVRFRLDSQQISDLAAL
jgi:Cu/Ag efflux protein CusF